MRNRYQAGIFLALKRIAPAFSAAAALILAPLVVNLYFKTDCLQRQIAAAQERIEDVEMTNRRLRGINSALGRKKNELKGKLSQLICALKEKGEQNWRLNKRIKALKKQFRRDVFGWKKKFYSLQRENRLLVQSITFLQVALEENKVRYYRNLGDVYFRTDQPDKAIELYQKALSIDPKSSGIHYRLGLLYEHIKKDPDSAITYYSSYLQLEPDAGNKEAVLHSIDYLSQKILPVVSSAAK